jgi:hypothetical protein
MVYVHRVTWVQITHSASLLPLLRLHARNFLNLILRLFLGLILIIRPLIFQIGGQSAISSEHRSEH